MILNDFFDCQNFRQGRKALMAARLRGVSPAALHKVIHRLWGQFGKTLFTA
jgi:hypothetical protein